MNPSTPYRTVRHSQRSRQPLPPPLPSGGGHPALAIIPLLVAAVACAFTLSISSRTSTHFDLRQELAARQAALAQSVSAAVQQPPAEEEAAPVAALPAEPDASVTVTARLSQIFTPEVQYWGKRILAWSEEWGLDPNLVATVMQIESCGDPLATSHAGAMGLFQVMPYHFEAGENSYDPATNARRGLGYLSDSLATHITPRLALAGYNGGINGVKRPEYQWANETVRYAYWGSGIYAEASAGDQESATLNEWLNAGGASLCAQARQRLGLP